MSKKFVSLLIGGALLWGGGCVPNRFWSNTWSTVLTGATNQVTGAVVQLYVVDPILDSVQLDDDAE